MTTWNNELPCYGVSTNGLVVGFLDALKIMCDFHRSVSFKPVACMWKVRSGLPVIGIWLQNDLVDPGMLTDVHVAAR